MAPGFGALVILTDLPLVLGNLQSTVELNVKQVIVYRCAASLVERER